MPSLQRPKVFILGSCVSRDGLVTAQDAFELTQYIARTSLASFGAKSVSDKVPYELMRAMPSPFQQRMLLNDLEKGTAGHLHDDQHDLLLLDFVDERFMLVMADSTFYSLSGELEKAGFDRESRTLLAPGSDEFMALWIQGLDRLIASVDCNRVVLNRVYWAEQMPDGSVVSSLGWIRRNNDLLKRLYEAVDVRWRPHCIEYPEKLLCADPDHRWGVAPYHYTAGLYQYMTAELQRIANATR